VDLLAFVVCPHTQHNPYGGTSLMRKNAPLGPYRRTVHRAVRWSQGRVCFL